MGCCCSRGGSKNDKEAEKKTQKWSKSSFRRRSRKSLAPSARYYGYEKVSMASSVDDEGSSRLLDAPAYVGLWNHTPGSEAELSIRVGDMFRLMGDSKEGDGDTDWLFVMRSEEQQGESGSQRRLTGYVPKAYVALYDSLEAEPWYFGQISGEEAEKLLRPLPDCTFLVRKRPTFIVNPKTQVWHEICDPGQFARSEYAVTIKYKGKIYNRPIYEYTHTKPGRFFLTKYQNFNSVTDLINMMRDSTGAVTTNKLPCNFVKWPVKPPPPRVAISVEAQRNWREIPRSQIKLGAVKGEGHFGVVYEAVWNTRDGMKVPVAVKALRKGSTKAKRKFLQEAATMKGLSHKNLVKLYGVVSEAEPIWIITEFVKDGSLLSYLVKRRSSVQLLPEKTLVDICAQICDGMRYLEEKKVVHRDLAARNVLVSEQTPGPDPTILVKVADFGLARLVDPSKLKSSDKRSPKSSVDLPTKWTAPEALKHNEYSTASDAWSFGIVTHEVFTHGLEPYGILLNAAVRDYVMHKRQILRQHSNVPDKAYEMMKKCFDFDPKKRPTFKDMYIFFHSYYRKPGETSLTAE